jgi:hypothetical protein
MTVSEMGLFQLADGHNPILREGFVERKFTEVRMANAALAFTLTSP